MKIGDMEIEFDRSGVTFSSHEDYPDEPECTECYCKLYGEIPLSEVNKLIKVLTKYAKE